MFLDSCIYHVVLVCHHHSFFYCINRLFDFNIDFRLKLAHIDEVSNGKPHMVKEIVECTGQMQVFCQFLVKAFIPVRWWTVHANEMVEGIVDVHWKCECWQSHTIFI